MSEDDENDLQHAAVHTASTAALSVGYTAGSKQHYKLIAILGRTVINAGSSRQAFKYDITLTEGFRSYSRSNLEGWNMKPMLDKFDEVYDGQLALLASGNGVEDSGKQAQNMGDSAAAAAAAAVPALEDKGEDMQVEEKKTAVFGDAPRCWSNWRRYKESAKQVWGLSMATSRG